MNIMQQKLDYWGPLVGKTVIAKNHRGETGTGTLLSVGAGMWGYGGDSVALDLDVKDERGGRHWPAGLCVLAEQ